MLRNAISKEYDIDMAESDSILLNNIIDLSELSETIDKCRKKNEAIVWERLNSNVRKLFEEFSKWLSLSDNSTAQVVEMFRVVNNFYFICFGGSDTGQPDIFLFNFLIGKNLLHVHTDLSFL